MAIRVGIAGTGWVTGLHIEALKKIDDVAIRAISGRNVARARELAAGVGAAVYDHWRKMLDQEQLDVVFVLLPPHLHSDVAIACAQCAKGVFVEKPICLDMETAQRVQAAFQQANTLASAGYMSRCRESVQKTRALFSAENPVALVNGWWVTGMPGPLWWRTFDQSGGQFVEQCTHLVDAARYIVGEITEVSAYATRGFITGVPDSSVDDAMVVNVRFASGAIGNFTTACHPQGFGDIGLKLSSRSTQCTLTDWSMDLNVERHNVAAEQHKSAEDIFAEQDRLFIQAVRENNPSQIRSSYADAMRTLRVTLAANESAQTGRTVRI